MTEPHCGPYSLVMPGFQGHYRAFQEEAERQFERRVLSAFFLCCGRDYLPAEIAVGLRSAEADSIAEVFTTTGAILHVVQTAKVEGVRYRASDDVPNRVVGDWHFTEVDGLILTRSPLNARHIIRQGKERKPSLLPWQLERFLNSQHPTHEYSRLSLRVARATGEDLATALRFAYPQRGFVLTYLDNKVSFYQRGDNAPENDEPPTSPLPIGASCRMCKKSGMAYRLREQPDEEFLQADWGECADCGAEMLIRTWEVRVIV